MVLWPEAIYSRLLYAIAKALKSSTSNRLLIIFIFFLEKTPSLILGCFYDFQEKEIEWGKGLAQKREAEARVKELELEKDRPFARTRYIINN